MSPEERELDKERQRRSDIEVVMSTENGRRFVWDLIGHCGVYRSLEGDQTYMLIQEGARRVGLHIIGIVTDVDEMAFLKMMAEARNNSIEESYYDNRNSDTTELTTEQQYDYATGGYDSGEPIEYTTGNLGGYL